MKKRFPWYNLLLLAAGLLVVMVWAISVGSADLSMIDSWKMVIGKIPGLKNLVDISEFGKNYEIIIWNVRMPRLIMAALAGGSLAMVGATFQGIFQNSLADPHILGVSSGAALGATIAMVTGISLNFWGLGTVGIFAFAGAMITVLAVYRVAKISGEISTTNMLLTGTAISTLLSSLMSLIMTFNHDQISKVYMWTMGSFSSASWDRVIFMAVFSLIGALLMIVYSGKLNILMMGDEDAKSLGVDVDRVRVILIVISSLLVAAAVSVSGVIGFVGLIIPHCVRMISGSDNRKLIPYVWFVGAVFMIFCDTIARTIAAPTEIPVGVITAVFGAPYFIFLVLTRRRRF